MKTTLRTISLAAALALAAPAVAQDRGGAAVPPGGRVGLGVGLSTAGSSSTSQLVAVPINVSPRLRLEPLLGWARYEIDVPPPTFGGSPFSPSSGEGSDFTFGFGVFYVAPVASQVQLYAGGRLLSQWESARTAAAAPDRWERRNTILAPTLGAEFLPHPRIALGAEAMLGLVSYGDTKYTDGPTGVTAKGEGGSGSFTQGTLFARFYLF